MSSKWTIGLGRWCVEHLLRKDMYWYEQGVVRALSACVCECVCVFNLGLSYLSIDAE